MTSCRSNTGTMSDLLNKRKKGCDLYLDTAVKTGSKINLNKDSIRVTKNFTELYTLSGDVMPSTHTGIRVRYAKRVSDNTDVVIKVRDKRKSFRGHKDEHSWRLCTESFLMLPLFQNVARVYEVLEDTENYYIIMEKLDGNDLFEILSESRSRRENGEVLEWTGFELAVHICRELLRALRYLHRNGMIHKDLKLENVMLHHGGEEDYTSPTNQSVVLIDFDTLEHWEPSSPRARDVLGTDQYIAPEAYSGNYSPKSDVFAVGVIAYKVLTGSYPFDEAIFLDEPGENFVGNPKMTLIQNSLKNAKVNFDRPSLKQHPEACDLIRKMISYDPQDRPNVDEALDHPWMKKSIEEEPIHSPKASMRRKSFDYQNPEISS